MGYATVADVAELCLGRTFGASSKPRTDQVVDFIDQNAAVIDGILRAQGYALPIASSATSALKLLEGFNALGAACLVEKGAPTSKPTKDGMNVCAMWREAQKMLRDGVIELDADIDTAESFPRHGGALTPMFTRCVEL